MAPEEIARTFARERPSGVTRAPGPETKQRLGNAPTMPPPQVDDVEGKPRYLLVRELGRGGMGRVDEVFDTSLGRPIAQKTVLQGAPAAQATMLIAEAQTSAQLEHPSIVPVYDLGSEYGQPYYTMRSVKGRTLGQVMLDNEAPDKEKKTLAQMLNILRQVCLAVDYAHSRGVVHRDLKPDNVIVGDFGEVYVLDWGIAHVMDGSDIKRTALNEFIAGSPGYMAPEQAAGGDIDGRTDVFALGAILHEILTGKVPFEDTDFQSIMLRSKSRIELVPSMRNPTLSSSFDTLVMACLEPNPNDRVPSARFVADAIDLYLDSERDKQQREEEAAQYTSDGESARETFITLDRESNSLRDEAEAELAKIPRWESVETKDAAWQKQAKARTFAAEAARSLARAKTAFSTALGRVENHKGARQGLAALYFREFEDAEEAGDAEAMAQHLDLARAYDDGPLALELANQGELVVECSHPDTELVLYRYEERGWLLELTKARPFEQGQTLLLEVGSYRITAKRKGKELLAPVLIRRAMNHRLRLEMGALEDLPKGMKLIPGGPFLAIEDERSLRKREYTLPDYAIGEFPVTMAEYAEFLDDLEPEERARRIPSLRDKTPFLVRESGRWRLTASFVEGEAARARVPIEHELQVAATFVSWFDAVAYAEWLSKKTGLKYRLPTSMEWEKAWRGVDGRAFPMGRRIDPAFAKLRESRPEVSQPEIVGSFPLDVSPSAVRDLAGGVHDWTSSSADAGDLPKTHEEEHTLSQQRQAIIRGAAWVSVVMNPLLSGAYRVIDRTGWVGFRVAMAFDEQSSFAITPMRR